MTDINSLLSCSLHSKNPEASFGDFDRFNDQLYENLKNSKIEKQEDIPYANGKLTKIDIWGPQNASKILIMIHGGYFLIGSRKKCLAVYDVASSLGYTVVTVGYDLGSKDHPLGMCIEETVKGVKFSLEKFSSAKTVVIGGHSTGGHLTFQVITAISDPRIKGAFMIAGIYKLDMLPDSKYGLELGLTLPEASKFSCDYNILKTLHFPILCTNCKFESPVIYQQNLDLKNHNPKIIYREYPDDDHYTILTNLTVPGNPVFVDFRSFLSQIH